MDPFKIKEPTIIPNRITISDLENAGTGVKFSKYYGLTSPLIKIGNVVLFDSMIKTMSLDLYGRVPSISFSISPMRDLFTAANYPTDGDIASVYIRSTHPEFKSITLDFRITSASSPVSTGDRMQFVTISIDGILDVKELYRDYCFATSGTSVDAFSEVADKTGLGLVINDKIRSDEMVHICAMERLVNHMGNVTKHSYKNEQAFYNFFIDQYLYINFIDVNERLESVIDEPGTTTFVNAHTSDYRADEGNPALFEGLLMLTNSSEAAGSPFHISGMRIINETGSISLNSGYKRYISFYDKNNKAFVQKFITPKINSVASAATVGREDEDIKDQITYVDKGYQFGDNVHENYYFAIEHNSYHNNESQKLGLEIDLKQSNPAIYKGMVIPVRVYDKPQLGDDSSEILNKFISGTYYVDGIKYNYNSTSGKYNMRVKLLKRGWDMS